MLFEELAADEEGHIDFLETQLELIRQVTLPLYAQHYIGSPEGDGTPRFDKDDG